MMGSYRPKLQNQAYKLHKAIEKGHEFRVSENGSRSRSFEHLKRAIRLLAHSVTLQRERLQLLHQVNLPVESDERFFEADG